MYRKILLPTDGSALARLAMQSGVEFAALCDAEVLGLHVAPAYQYPVSMEIIPPAYPSEEEYMAATQKSAEGYFSEARAQAEAKGLKFTGITAYANKTANKIVEVAQEQGCGLIFIGSHGRSGVEQLLLGSVTSRVLSLCDIPVLVYRGRKDAQRS
ncbi:universal stress protein [Herbaspirillum sp. HC18]|nr:universal stress protein [Herbaspirillum sp. HC18]